MYETKNVYYQGFLSKFNVTNVLCEIKRNYSLWFVTQNGELIIYKANQKFYSYIPTQLNERVQLKT